MAYHHSHKASSDAFGSAHLCARREFLSPRGLKEAIFLEDAETRVLHSTYSATLYLTASIAPVLPSQDPSNKAHFPSVPRNVEQFVKSRRNINASDGSSRTSENVAGSMDRQGLVPVDCLSRVHSQVKRIMGSGNVQQEQLNFSHVSTSFDYSLMLSSHQEASLSCLSMSLQNSHDSASSNLTSLQTFHMPTPHTSCDAMRQAREFCIEDPEAPSTPDLQPEVRPWACEALCTIGADQMLPADNLCPTGANDLLPVDNPCKKVADDMHLLAEENISIVQCPTGPTKSLHGLMNQGEDTCKVYNPPSYKCSSSSFCDYRESANSKQASRKLDSRACRQYMVQRLFYCLMISSLSICATPNNQKSHPQFLYTMWSFQRLIKLLKWEGLNCEGEVMCEQLLADIQIYLQVYKPRLIPDQKQKAMEVSTAASYSKQVAHKQAHSMVRDYDFSNGHHQKVDIVQEQALVMLQVFTPRYLARRSGNHFWLRCLYLEQGNVGNRELNQCGSILPSKVSASKSSNFLEIDDGKLPRSTEPSEKMNGCEEDFTESHRSSSWTRRVEEVDDWNSIPIEQVGECLDTCLLHLQARPSAFPSDLTSHLKLLDLSVVRNQFEAVNSKCSNGSIIDEGHQVCTKDNRHEASCLPMSAVDGPCSLTLSQCGSSLVFSMERSSMLHGGVHEKQSREKLKHFAEGFLLRRHIIQQQRRAQQAPPYPCRESAGLAGDEKGWASTGLHAGDEKGWASTGLHAGVKPSPYAYSSTNTSTKSSEDRNHEPTMILTSSLTKPCDVTASFCDHDNVVGADVVIDILGLVKHLESHSSQLETLTGAAANSIGCTLLPSTGGQLVIPNVSAVIVTIVAIVVYTKILLEGAFAWVGSRTQRKEEN